MFYLDTNSRLLYRGVNVPVCLYFSRTINTNWHWFFGGVAKRTSQFSPFCFLFSHQPFVCGVCCLTINRTFILWVVSDTCLLISVTLRPCLVHSPTGLQRPQCPHLDLQVNSVHTVNHVEEVIHFSSNYSDSKDAGGRLFLTLTSTGRRRRCCLEVACFLLFVGSSLLLAFKEVVSVMALKSASLRPLTASSIGTAVKEFCSEPLISGSTSDLTLMVFWSKQQQLLKWWLPRLSFVLFRH